MKPHAMARPHAIKFVSPDLPRFDMAAPAKNMCGKACLNFVRYAILRHRFWRYLVGGYMKKTALITGVTGQDGSYLAEFLIKKEYRVFGMARRTSSPHFHYLKDLLDPTNPGSEDFLLVQGDMMDAISINKIVQTTKPDEIYNLAAMSFVSTSWDQPLLTNDINHLGFLRVLESARLLDKGVRIYQASTSEMFGNVLAPQRESSRMMPRSPYGVSKLAAHQAARVYRESFDMFVSCGILFNHESPRRGLEFVTRKIAAGVASIKQGKADKLMLGNLAAKRDWGYAGDYVQAMWLILQQHKPDDFVIGTGESHSVAEFVDLAFSHVELNSGDYVQIDERFMRPAEIFDLRADYSKARRILGWQPKVSFQELVEWMVDHEMGRLRRERD
jgi:GDPmannose 4,6-dehydratase